MWSDIWSVATTKIGFWTWIYLWDILDWGIKWLVDFNAGKSELDSFDRSNNIGAIDVKMDGSVLEEKSSFKMLWLIYLLNCIGALTLALLLKLSRKRLEPWFILWSFFLLRLLCISINLSYGHLWNTVVMPGLLPLVATWNCWICYKNKYAGLLVLQLLPFLILWLIVKI